MLAAALSKRQRVKMLHRVLRKIQRHMTHYFGVYLLSLQLLMPHKLHASVEQQLQLQQGVLIAPWQLQQLTYGTKLLSQIIILRLLLLLAGRDFRRERTKCEQSLWRCGAVAAEPQLLLPQLHQSITDAAANNFGMWQI
ncbi:hypothetical protein AWZ03_009418 [Drosophila navojoa]|uniref:Uncharacterized protein n=1 Tax=Drosophila navojoa TaxID=7232 RepID=A0A484B8F7_DRONA|nr:hypothetical protein AWZ03_009418 [Drosophila navojoa]